MALLWTQMQVKLSHLQLPQHYKALSKLEHILYNAQQASPDISTDIRSA
jgi:hypothetical protein